jgi:glycosyltransferase involved in cell wall biosynthesis
MNIILVSHCNFYGQSAYHVHSIAKELTRLGCACIVCVPDGQDEVSKHVEPAVPILDYATALKTGFVFPDGGKPSLIHSWTPRENVRRFTEAVFELYGCPYFVHLEDNEKEVLNRELKSRGIEEADKINPEFIDDMLPPHLIHPARYLEFMCGSAGITVLIDRLLEHVPDSLPGLVFWPGYDEMFASLPVDNHLLLRKKYGVSEDSFVIYYGGNFNEINQDEARQMVQSFELMKRRGIPLHFVKTGLNTVTDIIEPKQDASISDLGFVPRAQLPELYAIADVVIQPGMSDAFNDYRFPSKLPEALISGKPVIMPRSNLGRFLTDGVEAMITETGQANELADKIKTLFCNPKLRKMIGAKGQAFAKEHLRWDMAAGKIMAFYAQYCKGRGLAGANSAVAKSSQNAKSVNLRSSIKSFAGIDDFTTPPANAADADKKISRMKYVIREQDIRINDLSRKLAQREEDVAALNEAMAEHDVQSVNLNQRYNESLKTIEEIRGSSSWRITAPIRYISSKLKNIIAVILLLPGIFRFGGGLVGSVRKAWRVLSREGWLGVKRRILFVDGHQYCITVSNVRNNLFSKTVNRNDYNAWIRHYDTITDHSRAAMKDRIDDFVIKPLISVVMPVYNPKPEWLSEAIESVRNQIYPFWELCIADDASTDKRIRPILEHYAGEDNRIKVVFRESNGHISAASNSALELVTGEYVALLDHDDLLAEYALFWVADAINRNPDTRLIYSDEDKINSSGDRIEPYFKCDWNPDLFYSQNMFCHLGVYHAGLLKEAGGFREGLEGAQDYDLALRCVELVSPAQIRHIPRVLYHWRAHAESTAKSGDAKRYALLAGERALNEHFRRQGVNANAELLDFGMYRIRYNLPNPLPQVSLIILSRNGVQLLKKCVESIINKTVYPNYEIIIVDNRSDDQAALQYFEQLQSDPKIRVIRDNRPFNFSALNNTAVKMAQGEIIGLLNNDLEVISAEWLSEMVSHALRPGVGAVGARLWYPDNTLQHGGIVIGLGGVAGHSHKYLPKETPGYFWRANLTQNYTAVTAACLVIRKSIYEEVGGFNETALPVAFNDVDFCLRVSEKGYRNVWTPYAELYHHESASRGYENTAERQKRFAKEVAYMKRRWGDKLLNDPAYSPNLTLDNEDFSFSWPPRVALLDFPHNKLA